jgi:hypothetical protein
MGDKVKILAQQFAGKATHKAGEFGFEFNPVEQPVFFISGGLPEKRLSLFLFG